MKSNGKTQSDVAPIAPQSSSSSSELVGKSLKLIESIEPQFRCHVGLANPNPNLNSNPNPYPPSNSHLPFQPAEEALENSSAALG